MVDVIIRRDVYEKSKIHATVIEKVRKEMMKNPSPTRPPPSGKKWEELVRLEGARYAAACRWEGDKVMVTSLRRSPTRRRRIRRKRS